MLPDKTTRCHRTGFRKTCFKCVTDYGCKLWKKADLTHHPETGAPLSGDYFDCKDSLDDIYKKDMLRRQLQTTATIDALRAQVDQSNDQQMVGLIGHLNRQLNGAAPQIAADAPKLIEQK